MIEAEAVPICSGKQRIEPSIKPAPRRLIRAAWSSTSDTVPVVNWAMVVPLMASRIALASRMSAQAL